MTMNETTLRNCPVSRKAVLAAIAEADELGREAFRTKMGRRASKKAYELRYNKKVYDSKPVMERAMQLEAEWRGIEYGLEGKDFSGGKKNLAPVFESLGFKLGVLIFAYCAKKIVTAAHKAFAKQVGAEIDATYYASGSTRVGQVHGFGHIDQAFMVTATEMSENVENALYYVAENSDAPVAVDSGAFTRTKINFPKKNGDLPYPKLPIGIHCENPFTDDEWQSIFNLYNRLGAAFGDRLMVVAPDQVGFQVETLDLIKKYKDEINSLLELGVNVMIVAQKGALSQIEFDKAATEILGRSDYVRGLPCNKAATTVAEIKAFAEAVQPEKLHLLGMGLRSPEAPKAAKAVAEASPNTALSYDSCLISESSGKKGRANHPYETPETGRVFTAAKNLARKLFGFVEGTEDPEYHKTAIRLAWGEDLAAEAVAA
jgi:hypothetical protein